MVRAAAKNHPSVAVVDQPRAVRATCSPRCADGGFDLAARKRLAAEAFQHTAAYDVAVASWFADGYAPADDSRASRTSSAPTYERKNVLRYGENPHQPAALYTDGSGRARRRRAAARQGDVVQQLRRHRGRPPRRVRPRRAVRRDHQARQPVRHRGRRGRRRGAPQGARLRPAVRVRRRHRRQPAGDRRDGRAGRRDLHRGHRRPGVRGRRGRGAGPQEEHPRAALRRRPGRGRSSSGRSRAARCSRSRTGSRPRATTRPTGPWPPARRWTRPSSPSWPSPGGPAARSSPTRSCSPRTARRSASAWARSTASTPRSSPWSGRARSGRRGSYAASDAFFPFPDGWRCWPRRASRPWSQPGGSVRDELVVEAAQKAGVTMYFTGTRHFFH